MQFSIHLSIFGFEHSCTAIGKHYSPGMNGTSSSCLKAAKTKSASHTQSTTLISGGLSQTGYTVTHSTACTSN